MTLYGMARYWCKVCFKQNRGAFELVPRSALRYFSRYCNTTSGTDEGLWRPTSMEHGQHVLLQRCASVPFTPSRLPARGLPHMWNHHAMSQPPRRTSTQLISQHRLHWKNRWKHFGQRRSAPCAVSSHSLTSSKPSGPPLWMRSNSNAN